MNQAKGHNRWYTSMVIAKLNDKKPFSECMLFAQSSSLEKTSLTEDNMDSVVKANWNNQVTIAGDMDSGTERT